MDKLLCALLMLATLAGCATNAPTQEAATSRARRAQLVRGTFGTYDNEPRLASRHVDARQLIAELVEQRANTYNWLVWHTTNDWGDLKLFLPLARKQHIK